MELKYQCSKCLDYKNENEFYKNRCYNRKCKLYYVNNVIGINIKSNDKRINVYVDQNIFKSSFLSIKIW